MWIAHMYIRIGICKLKTIQLACVLARTWFIRIGARPLSSGCNRLISRIPLMSLRSPRTCQGSRAT